MEDLLIYIANGMAITINYYQLEEIKSGKTTNKIWLTLMQTSLNYMSVLALSEVLSEYSNIFNFIKYAINGLIVIANYLCYVFESNEISDKNQVEQSRKTLPFNLDKDQTLKDIAQFISRNINLLQLGTYILALSLGIYYGLEQMVMFNLLGVLLEQIYQRNLLHKYLSSAYRMLRMVMLSGYLFGFNSWLFIAINLINIAIMLGDYVSTHLLGLTTASIQYPIARKNNQLILDNNKPNSKSSLQQLLNKIKNHPVEVTFDHMRQSALLNEKLTLCAKNVNYDKYTDLFSQIDFSKPELKELIEAEITANDDFMLVDECTHIENLQLPKNTTSYDIKIAYLKKEMSLMIERLKTSSPRNLTHEQVEILKGNGRRILEYLKKLNPKTDTHFNIILISLALQTGSHCSRVYIECFANIMREYDFQEIENLSLKERVLSKTQGIKSEAFFKFYQNLTYTLKTTSNQSNNLFNKYLFNFLWSDTNDYHTYENFCLGVGPNFYLDNQTYSIRFRGFGDIFLDVYLAITFTLGHPSYIFSKHYNAAYLILEVIEGKLAPDFKKWCDLFYPKAYEDYCLDEYHMTTINPNSVELATLMLLDCNIIHFKNAWSMNTDTVPTPSFYERSCEKYHQLIDSVERLHTKLN